MHMSVSMMAKGQLLVSLPLRNSPPNWTVQIQVCRSPDVIYSQVSLPIKPWKAARKFKVIFVEQNIKISSHTIILLSIGKCDRVSCEEDKVMASKIKSWAQRRIFQYPVSAACQNATVKSKLYFLECKDKAPEVLGLLFKYTGGTKIFKLGPFFQIGGDQIFYWKPCPGTKFQEQWNPQSTWKNPLWWTHTMEECTTSEVSWEPCKGLIHTGPGLEVFWVPVLRDVVLLDQVAQNGTAAEE